MANPPVNPEYSSTNLAEWKKQPPLKSNYVRLLSPEGDVEDIWRGHLEGTLDASVEALQMFYSQKQWETSLAPCIAAASLGPYHGLGLPLDGAVLLVLPMAKFEI